MCTKPEFKEELIFSCVKTKFIEVEERSFIKTTRLQNPFPGSVPSNLLLSFHSSLPTHNRDAFTRYCVPDNAN